MAILRFLILTVFIGEESCFGKIILEKGLKKEGRETTSTFFWNGIEGSRRRKIDKINKIISVL